MKILFPSPFKIGFLICALWIVADSAFAQTPLIANVAARKTTSLDGKWQYIVDPYETGYYNYRFQERNENDREAYWNSDVPDNKTDRKEHGFTDEYAINVPGDWNSQDAKFTYYEGTVWYKKSFDYPKLTGATKLFVHFGAVNYKADVYLNGKKLGEHKGGFTAFNFEIPTALLKEKGNFLVVKVDNKRFADEIPTVNTDWWNYGGITREVTLIELPSSFIQDYTLQLKKASATGKGGELEGWVQLANTSGQETVTVEIPEAKFKKSFEVKDGRAKLELRLSSVQRWSTDNPKLYRVIISTKADRVEDKMGFRTIEVKGKQVLLNGKPLFLRGICVHEEIPQDARRAYSRKDALQLLGWARDLNANMVRLAHYPHNENSIRVADSLGILVWSEIPVYWTVNFKSPEVLEKAKVQLKEMIARDHNRASIIIWSVGNETPVSETRTEFMRVLIQTAKELDATRLVSAALEVHYDAETKAHIVNDPLGQYTDLVAVNEYLGWYGGLPSNCQTAKWEIKYDKPMFISETGAEALGGFHGDSLTRWSEEYQAWYYQEQVAMMKRMPDNYMGISPWILVDFRSPKRNNPHYQEGWNNKGLLDHQGKPKKAFGVLKAYYDEMEKKYKNATK